MKQFQNDPKFLCSLSLNLCRQNHNFFTLKNNFYNVKQDVFHQINRKKFKRILLSKIFMISNIYQDFHLFASIRYCIYSQKTHEKNTSKRKYLSFHLNRKTLLHLYLFSSNFHEKEKIFFFFSNASQRKIHNNYILWTEIVERVPKYFNNN